MAILQVKVLTNQAGSKYVGYYDHKRRKPGDVFQLQSEADFSANWMEPIGWKPQGYIPGVTKPRASGPESLPRTRLSATPSAAEKELAALRKRLDALETENAELKKAKPEAPATAAPPAAGNESQEVI